MLGATADKDVMAAHPPPPAGRDMPHEQCGGEDTETAAVPCCLCLRFSLPLPVILRVGGVVVLARLSLSQSPDPSCANLVRKRCNGQTETKTRAVHAVLPQRRATSQVSLSFPLSRPDSACANSYAASPRRQALWWKLQHTSGYEKGRNGSRGTPQLSAVARLPLAECLTGWLLSYWLLLCCPVA